MNDQKYNTHDHYVLILLLLAVDGWHCSALAVCVP
jgi:hypothetical protein